MIRRTHAVIWSPLNGGKHPCTRAMFAFSFLYLSGAATEAMAQAEDDDR